MNAAKIAKHTRGAADMTKVSTSNISMNVTYTVNVVKKKLETYIPDVVVLKNQIPSNYRKLHSKFYDDNKYYN